MKVLEDAYLGSSSTEMELSEMENGIAQYAISYQVCKGERLLLSKTHLLILDGSIQSCV